MIQLFLRCLRPKVVISNKIAESASSELIFTHRIKVQNLSKRDIGDISMKISYRSKTKGHYTFSVKDILYKAEKPTPPILPTVQYLASDKGCERVGKRVQSCRVSVHSHEMD